MFGGRVAEEIQFGPENVTTGAGDDIRQATDWARRMVTEFGFSEKLGPLRYSDNEEEVFLGHSVTQRKNVSDATAALIDSEIRAIIEVAEGAARKILVKERAGLDAIAEALLEYETLSGEEIKGLLRGEPIFRPADDDTPMESRRRSSVPTSGSAEATDKGDEPDVGMEPEPQPGR
jgi:cell division protease FtsH